MYVFVFMWTPTLNEVRTTAHAPHPLSQCSQLTMLGFLVCVCVCVCVCVPCVPCVQDPSAPAGQVLPYGVIFACFMVRQARRLLRMCLSYVF